MRRRKMLAAAVACGLLWNGSARAANDLYWDSNGNTTGSGTSPTGTWGTSNFWNTASDGTTSSVFTTATGATNDVHFSAGTNATGAFTVTVSGAQAANRILFEEGTATLSGGTSLTLGTGATPGITKSAANATTVSTAVVLASSQAFANNAAGLLTFGAGGVTANAASGTTTLTLSSTGTGGTTFGGVIGDGSAGGNIALAISSTSGVTTLGAGNTYTGGTTVSAGAVLAVSAAGQLGNSDTTVSGGILRLAAAANVQTANGRGVSVVSTPTALGVLGLTANFAPAGVTFASTNTAFDGVLSVDTTGFNAVADPAALGPNDRLLLGSSTTGTYTGALPAGAGGTYRLGGGGGTLTLSTAVLTGANNVVVGAEATNGGGTVNLLVDGNWTGTTTVNNGQLNVPTFAGTGTGPLALGTATTTGILGFTNAATVSSSRAVTLGAAGGGFDAVDPAGQLTVTNALTTAGRFVKGPGAGTVVLTAANTFTAGVTVQGGTLRQSASGALGNGGSLVVSAGTLDLGGFIYTTNSSSVTLGGGAAGTTAAIVNVGTLTTAGTVNYLNTNNAGAATISGTALNLGTAVKTFNVNDSTGATDDLTLALPLIGTSAAGLTKGAQNGTLVLTGVNTYPGATLVSGGTLKLGATGGNSIPANLTATPGVGSSSINLTWLASNQIADTATLSLGGVAGNGGTIADLAGFNETVAALTFVNNQGTGGSSITSGTAGLLTINGTITFSGSSAASTAPNLIAGNLSLGGATRTLAVTTTNAAVVNQITALISNGGLTKTGASTIQITNALNSYAGGTTVSDGTLVVTGVASPGIGRLGTGDVTVLAGTTTSPTLQLNHAAAIADTATLTVNNGAFPGIVNLNFTGTEVVGGLVLGGTSLGEGLYDATTNPTFLTGTGKLQVVVPEPGTAAATAGLLAAGGLLRRRRWSA